MNKIVEKLATKAVTKFLDSNPKHESLSIGICEEFSALFMVEIFFILAEKDAPLTIKQMTILNNYFKSGIENE